MWRRRQFQPTAPANFPARVATASTSSGWPGRATNFHVGFSHIDPRECNRRDLSPGGYRRE
jgi:hypothetical protein